MARRKLSASAVLDFQKLVLNLHEVPVRNLGGFFLKDQTSVRAL